MSGLSHHPGKVAQGQLCREFESLALRQLCTNEDASAQQIKTFLLPPILVLT